MYHKKANLRNIIAGQVVPVVWVIPMCTDPRKPLSITIPWHTLCLTGCTVQESLLCAARHWTGLGWTRRLASNRCISLCMAVRPSRACSTPPCTSFTVTISRVRSEIFKWAACYFYLFLGVFVVHDGVSYYAGAFKNNVKATKNVTWTLLLYWHCTFSTELLFFCSLSSFKYWKKKTNIFSNLNFNLHTFCKFASGSWWSEMPTVQPWK